MNRRPVKQAAAVTFLAIISIAASWWFVSNRKPPAPSESAAPPPQVPKPELSPASQADAPDPSAHVLELEQRLTEEQRARQKAEADNAALRAQLDPHGEVIVSLGKIEDIGKRTGFILSALGELQELSGRDPSTLTADERRRLLELQRNHAAVVGMLPEIAGFQDNPGEYGRFFRSMLQEAGGLNDAQAAQVESLMTQRATIMNQLGLNDGKKPGDQVLADQWETRRDQFNEETADGLIAILPPAAVKQSGFSSEVLEYLEQDFDKVGNKKP